MSRLEELMGQWRGLPASVRRKVTKVMADDVEQLRIEAEWATSVFKTKTKEAVAFDIAKRLLIEAAKGGAPQGEG